ncbi:MAG: hypothetical protein HY690_16450 [Chloroflexi bacterium]|nr:hypothetical protein [Chloroflexota bacterium]
MAVNALLPWAFAWGEVAGRVALQRAASGCYQAHPRCAENHVTREAARLLGLNPRVARTACQQQGLLHLYRQRLHRPECWRQDPDGRWRWRPWVEALDRVDSRQLTVERAPADCQLWTVDCGLDLDAAVPAALPAAG